MVCRSAAVLLHPVILLHDTRAFGQRAVCVFLNPVGICVQEFPQNFVEDWEVLSKKRNTIAKHHYFLSFPPLWSSQGEGGTSGRVEGVC